MSMKLSLTIATVLCALALLAGCAEMHALEAQLSANIDQHPLGPLGPGLDMYLTSEQIRALKGR